LSEFITQHSFTGFNVIGENGITTIPTLTFGFIRSEENHEHDEEDCNKKAIKMIQKTNNNIHHFMVAVR
jgi:hypothetical protein